MFAAPFQLAIDVLVIFVRREMVMTFHFCVILCEFLAGELKVLKRFLVLGLYYKGYGRG